jgi:uncharacterized membrane protein (DUF2068 family)
MSANKGLRVIAFFEALKGSFALVLATGALLLPQHDLQLFVLQLVEALRLDPAAHYTSRFIEEASLVTPQRLVWVAAGAYAYGVFRFGEAYGLWRARPWAEWLAVVSGAIYIPFEIYALFRKPSLIKFAVFVINLLVVLYVARNLASKSVPAAVKKPEPA